MNAVRNAWVAVLLSGLLVLWALPGVAQDADDPLVDLSLVAPTVVYELRYATTRNFLGEVLYDSGTCWIRKSVARRIARVQAALERQGYGLKVWDAYRPPSVQQKMWRIKPDTRYVADPKVGSVHNRGAALDVTLVDSAGRELDMGTDHDEFSERAAPDAEGLSSEVIKNRRTLAQAMAAEGFIQLDTEWWHFDAPGGQSFPIIAAPPGAKSDRATTKQGSTQE